MNHITCQRDYNRLTMNNFGKVIVLVFHAEWHEYSQDYIVNFEQLFEMQELDSKEVIFAHLDAELVPEVALKYNVNNVPTVVFTDAQKAELKKFENMNPALIFEEIENFLQEYKQKFEEKRISMYKKIEQLTTSSDVLIFIKGTPTDPECKFTRQFLEIMKDLQCKFTYYDIIADNDMRHWLRHYNKWPTYPQIYIAGQLIGGLDKTKQLIAENALSEKIPQAARIHDPESRLKKIVSENPVILITEGTALDSEQTDSAKKSIELLKYNGIKFNCFDASTDELLFSYIKEKVGSLPLLYSNGKKIGSEKEIQQLVDTEQLLNNIPGSNWQLDGLQKLKYLLQNCPIIAFINGIPKECHNEESLKVIEILTKLNVIYEFYNVDADSEVLDNLKSISNYDKTPQLYINGKLIGGAEAVTKLHADGDLQELVKDIAKKTV